jgi:hypothetical protein
MEFAQFPFVSTLAFQLNEVQDVLRKFVSTILFRKRNKATGKPSTQSEKSRSRQA